MSTNSSISYIERAFRSKPSPTLGISPYEELANAIVLQAVTDYRNALRGKGKSKALDKKRIKECEKFFRSEWYSILTKYDGERLIKRLQEEYHNESKTRSANT